MAENTINNMENTCIETVYIPEKLRHTGKGKTGFERHYTKRMCKRKIAIGRRCTQHYQIWKEMQR